MNDCKASIYKLLALQRRRNVEGRTTRKEASIAENLTLDTLRTIVVMTERKANLVTTGGREGV